MYLYQLGIYVTFLTQDKVPISITWIWAVSRVIPVTHTMRQRHADLCIPLLLWLIAYNIF